eukprot:UN03367
MLLWCCLQCAHLGCPRTEEGHSVAHYKKTGHCIFINSEGSGWCHECDAWLKEQDIQRHRLNANINKFGGNYQSKVNSIVKIT